MHFPITLSQKKKAYSKTHIPEGSHAKQERSTLLPSEKLHR